MRRRVSRAEIVNRVHNAARKELTPNSIHRRLREVWVRGHPAGKLLAWVSIRSDGEFRIVQQSGLNRKLRARMQQLDTSADILRTQVHIGRMVDHHRTYFEEPRKVRSHSPELVLTPVFVRMIVTLRAIESPSHEDSNLFSHCVAGAPDLVVWQEMPRCRAVPLRRNTFLGDLIVRTICLNIGADPLPIFFTPLGR